MITFSHLRGSWNLWWFRETPPHLLAIFRIIFGGFLLFYFGIQFPHIAMLYSREGILLPLVPPTTPLTLIFTPPPVWAAYLIFSFFLASLLALTAGCFSRAAAMIALILYAYYYVLSLFQFGTSYDRLFLFTTLILAFSGCGQTFSVDAKLRGGSWTAWEPISILPQRILSVQIMMTYLGVGWQKLVLPDWQSGEILAYGFTGRWATAPAYWIARLNIPLWYYDRVVWLIKAFEITIPFGLWHPRTRWWYFAGGAAFHIGIAILLAIWWFLALIPAYILFFEPEDCTAFLRRASPRLAPSTRGNGGRSTGSWNSEGDLFNAILSRSENNGLRNAVIQTCANV